MMVKADKIIIGAGLYGLYAALYCAQRGQEIIVLERDKAPFLRATYINQARVHMGYHYPRSLSTALKSAGYFKRFLKDYEFCIYKQFEQIYATSAKYSWTNAIEFKKFCSAAEIKCEEIPVTRYFKDDMCDGAFLTEEYTYDAQVLKEYFWAQLLHYKNVKIKLDVDIQRIERNSDSYHIITSEHDYSAKFILNATYASVNQILNLMHTEGGYNFDIKYELCEIILCNISDNFKHTGITVMDGPFFSIMPFGKTGYHSLTSVTFTPHMTSFDTLPRFKCQQNVNSCSPVQLGNCNQCIAHPKSSWDYMERLARKYLKDEFNFEYKKSLFSVKPILKTTEIDDSRPTVIRMLSKDPTFVSVLSGKINTVYDLDDILEEG